jgi:2'-5' RNA ligase
VRLFVAIFPPPEVRRAALESARQSLVEGQRDLIRWVPPENAHLTLKFLGDLEREAVPGVEAALAAVCARHGPFGVRLSGMLGAFPAERRASVLWAGISEGSEDLSLLAADVEAALEPLGFPAAGRPYRPHLTLGRARGRPLRLELPRSAVTLPGFRAERVWLVESSLGPKGASYRGVEGYPLGGGPEDS